ncbi:MAG TPA: glycosyltransferase family 4 protein [Tepidisphaeraceae bacterium]|nr:glycosyltransferase family 4 protein [Tepidisphaeraceae bacterium]
MQLRMIYSRLFDFDGREISVGGIQTYLRELANCAAEWGFDPILYQSSLQPFERKLGRLTVRGIVAGVDGTNLQTRQTLYAAATKGIESSGDILLFGSDIMTVPTGYSRAVLIQHGIHWDKPAAGEGRLRALDRIPVARAFRVARRHLHWIGLFENCRYHVCVDYNFQNWYRTFRPAEVGTRTWVIPNSAPVLDNDAIQRKLRGENAQVRVLFARRFEEYRGSRLMGDVVASLLPQYPHLLVTFAGDGPDRPWLVKRFAGEPRVTIAKVPFEQRMDLNYEHDISVVPSLGSEGTSLSVAEAMGAGCAVVATDVGGITNMVLDEFNGLLIPSDRSQLEQALSRLIHDAGLRRRLAMNGYAVACSTLSQFLWRERWKQVLREISKSND